MRQSQLGSDATIANRSIDKAETDALLPYIHAATERRNFEMAVLDVSEGWRLTRDQTLTLLKAEGAAISPYYSPPLHKTLNSTESISVPELPVSEELATRFIQLPVGELVSLDDVAEIGAFLSFVQEHHADISARLRAIKHG